MRLGLRDGYPCLNEAVGSFANKFCEKAPIPFVRRPAPLGRTVAVHQAIVEDIRPLRSGMVEEVRVCSAKPKVVAPRRHAGDSPKHGSGLVGRDDIAERRLWTGHSHAGEQRGFNARADFGGAVLEAPLHGGIEIRAGLDARRSEPQVPTTAGTVTKSVTCGVKP